MAQIIGLPKLSPTMEEGVLVRWVKKEGDSVSPGDLVAEVETDKANMDFTLEDEGVILKLLVAEGDTVALGAPVAILGEQGEDIAALLAEAQAQTRGGQRSAPAASAAPAAPAIAVAPQPAPSRTPGPAAAGPASSSSASPPTSRAVLASPLAKTLALELGVDLRGVQGTGPGGRIVERDVRATAEREEAGAAPPGEDRGDATGPTGGPSIAATSAPANLSTALALRAPAAPLAQLPLTDEYVEKPLSAVRKRIAARLTEAKREVPHFYLTRSFDAEPVLDFRARLNHLLGDRGKVSVNDLLIKGVALALRRVPECNAAFAGDAIRYYTRVHIGVAVAIEDGLVTPVVRDADLKGIGVIAAEVRDLAGRARTRALKVHEIQGSTFSISNLGMYGVEHFGAIINPPEGAILAVGTVMEQPVLGDGVVRVGKRITLTMSCDHRVIDGALGARYLSELVALLERPESLAL